jgi:hypothetical protein
MPSSKKPNKDKGEFYATNMAGVLPYFVPHEYKPKRTLAVFSHITQDGKWVCVHHPDEPDMQSKWMIPATAIVKVAIFDPGKNEYFEYAGKDLYHDETLSGLRLK